ANSSRQEDAVGYFAPLASAKYVLLTTFTRDGMPVSTPARVVVDGGRAYFRLWSPSAPSNRFSHTDWVQVAPRTVLGLWRYGSPVKASAGMRAGDEASRAAVKLARKYPIHRGSLNSWFHRVRGRRLVLYELRADDPAERSPDQHREGPDARVSG